MNSHFRHVGWVALYLLFCKGWSNFRRSLVSQEANRFQSSSWVQDISLRMLRLTDTYARNFDFIFICPSIINENMINFFLNKREREIGWQLDISRDLLLIPTTRLFDLEDQNLSVLVDGRIQYLSYLWPGRIWHKVILLWKPLTNWDMGGRCQKWLIPSAFLFGVPQQWT